MGSFKFVFIPADDSQPMQELEQEIVEGKEVECLTHRLQQHFRDTTPVTASSLEAKERRRAMLQQHMKDKPVTDEMMDAVGDMQMVETVTLLSGNEENGFTHINLYVDDTGSVKGLPDNARAAGLARAAGHPAEVHGDAFVARVVDCDAAFERQNFTLKEVDSGAAWIKAANARNASRREAAARLPSMLPPGAAHIDIGGSSSTAIAAAAAREAADATQSAAPDRPYTYSQDNTEVVLELPVPASTKAKDVSCAIKVGSIELSVASLDPRTILSGPLFQSVRPDECAWTLANTGPAGGRVLQLTLSKKEPLRWLGVLRSG